MNEYWAALYAAVIVASVSQILLKKSALQEHASFIKEYLNFRVVTGYGMMLLSTVLTIFAFKGLSFKNVPIVESLGYILVMLLSWWFLKEKVTKRKIIGNACILVGILIFYM